METLHESAYAKLNLTLDVLGRRSDGYHDLQSVMQSISLRDDIELDVGTGRAWHLSCTDPSLPNDGGNLAWRAAEAFCRATGKDPGGLEIRIRKRIPAQAGLGGGSADAAAVLRALNRHYGQILTLDALAALGAEVGSDVPFCVLCGTAMAEGRGEQLRRLPDMPECVFVVCKPAFSVSTPALYRKLDTAEILSRPDNRAMETALLAGNLRAVAENVCNVFDGVVAAEHPEIGDIKDICRRSGALGQQMTGSGSAVFAIMPSEECAEAACKALEGSYPQVFTARPV